MCYLCIPTSIKQTPNQVTSLRAFLIIWLQNTEITVSSNMNQTSRKVSTSRRAAKQSAIQLNIRGFFSEWRDSANIAKPAGDAAVPTPPAISIDEVRW